MTNIFYKVSCIAIGFMLLSTQSCKKYPDSPPVFQPYDSINLPPDRRILVIGIDGLNSNAFQTAGTTNYTTLLQHAKYAWDAKSDVISKDASAWKTLTSGVTYSSHHISDSSFLQDSTSVVPDIENFQQAANYPSVFGFLIRSKLYNTPTTVLSSWGKMASSTMPEVPTQYILPNDVAVKDSTVSLLKNGDSKVIMVHFNTPAKVAVNPGDPTASFSASSAPYTTAMKTVDGYIGEIMTALKARPNYNKSEQWLVVVTGTHGGINKTYGGTTDDETNVPILYYNENFVKQEFTKQGSFSSVTLTGNTSSTTVNASVASDAFNFGTQSNKTVQFKVNMTSGAYYPVIMSKMGTSDITGSGWAVFMSGTNWCLQIGGKRPQSASASVCDGNWHTCTFVLYDTTIGGTVRRYVKRFTDGARINDALEVSSSTDISSTAPFTLGYASNFTANGNGGYNPVKFADIAFFNTALTDKEIADNTCTDITKNPEYSKLYAYWPCNEGIGGVFNNKVNPNQNLTLSGPYNWALQSTYPCSFTPNPPSGKTTMMMKNVDVSVQIFYWLGLSIPSAWITDGNVWLNKYENEFYKK